MAKNTNNRFDLLALAVIVVPVLLVAVANCVVDPFALWHTPPIKGLSAEKPRRSDKDRLEAALVIETRRPKAIILGASTSKQLSAKTLQQLTGDGAGNAGMVMAGLDEAREYLDRALGVQPNVRHVVINLDFFQFGEREDSSPRRIVPPYTPRTMAEDALSVVCSRAGLMATVETIRANGLLGKMPTGATPAGAAEAATPATASAAPTTSVPPNAREQLFRGNLVTLLKENSTYLPYTPSEQAYENLRAVKAICDARGVELTVFLNPMHAHLMDGLYARGLGDEYENWMRRVASITPAWDFAGYNSITTETVGGAMRYYRDPIHYTDLTGDFMLRRMLAGDKAIPGFGAPIDSTTVEQRILDLSAQRARHQVR